MSCNSCQCSLFALQQENYRKDLSLKDAEVMALSTLKEVMEEKVTLQYLLSICMLASASACSSIGQWGMLTFRTFKRLSLSNVQWSADACANHI